MSFDDTATTSVSSTNPISSNNSGNDDDSTSESFASTNSLMTGEESAMECACGRKLSPGWSCPVCRRSCPLCQRALIFDSSDYCDRCYSFCDIHGLYRSDPSLHVTPCPEWHPPQYTTPAMHNTNNQPNDATEP
jgi:hypothetical protein